MISVLFFELHHSCCVLLLLTAYSVYNCRHLILIFVHFLFRRLQ